MNREVLVVIGIGGMGLAIARRQGTGKAVLLADFDESRLTTAADTLRAEGQQVTTHRVDVSSAESVASLAKVAASLGPVTQIAHTAGLSPAQAPAETIMKVNLAGVAHVLAEFGRVVAPGGAGVIISSMAGHMTRLTAEEERALARGELPALGDSPPEAAYARSKRANHIQVQSASVAWGQRGARINAISPGVVSTPMSEADLASDHGTIMRTMIDTSPTGRMGTPDDIAAAAAFLLGPESTFITGSDLLVDGGVVAAMRSAQPTHSA